MTISAWIFVATVAALLIGTVIVPVLRTASEGRRQRENLAKTGVAVQGVVKAVTSPIGGAGNGQSSGQHRYDIKYEYSPVGSARVIDAHMVVRASSPPVQVGQTVRVRYLEKVPGYSLIEQFANSVP
jgi:hypothetical protein